MTFDLPAVPAPVATIAVCASVHDSTFAQLTGLHPPARGRQRPRLRRAPDVHRRAVVLVEFYRRDTTWRVRVVGQGYDDGLAGLARDFGVTVT